MKAKYLMGAITMGAIFTGCSDDLVENNELDIQQPVKEIKGHDLLTNGLKVSVVSGANENGTRVADGKWQASDKLGLAWYNVSADGITSEQLPEGYNNADFSDSNVYGNAVLKPVSGGFETRSNIYKGAYFAYFPWNYEEQAAQMVWYLDPVQSKDYTYEKNNKLKYITGSKFFSAETHEEITEGELTEPFVLNPAQNALRVNVNVVSEKMANALKDNGYRISAVTLKDNTERDGQTSNFGNTFPNSIAIVPSMLPHAEADELPGSTDVIIKTFANAEYAQNASNELLTVIDNNTLTLNDWTNENGQDVRVFTFPTKDGYHLNENVPTTSYEVEVTDAAGTPIMVFTIDEEDQYEVDGKYLNQFSVEKFAELLTEEGTDPFKAPGVAEENSTKIIYIYYNRATAETIESESETAPEGCILIGKKTIVTTIDEMSQPGISLTQIMRWNGMYATASLPIYLTTDNMHAVILDAISNEDEWNAAVEFVNNFYEDGSEVTFTIDNDVEFTGKYEGGIPMPTLEDVTINVKRAASGNKLSFSCEATMPENIVGVYDSELSPKNFQIDVKRNGKLTVNNAPKKTMFRTVAANEKAECGIIIMGTPKANINVGAGNNHGAIIIPQASIGAKVVSSADNAGDGKVKLVIDQEYDNAAEDATIAFENALVQGGITDLVVVGTEVVLSEEDATAIAGVDLTLVNGKVSYEGDLTFGNIKSIAAEAANELAAKNITTTTTTVDGSLTVTIDGTFDAGDAYGADNEGNNMLVTGAGYVAGTKNVGIDEETGDILTKVLVTIDGLVESKMTTKTAPVEPEETPEEGSESVEENPEESPIDEEIEETV